VRQYLLWACESRNAHSLIAPPILAACDELLPGRARSPSTNPFRPDKTLKNIVFTIQTETVFSNIPEVATFEPKCGLLVYTTATASSQFQEGHWHVYSAASYLLLLASTAATFRLACGSERGPPACSTQRFPAGTPHVGHGSFFFIEYQIPWQRSF
jgi:hypothetical protein